MQAKQKEYFADLIEQIREREEINRSLEKIAQFCKRNSK